MRKLNIDNYSVSSLSNQEKLDIVGGDRFLSDLGKFFGNIGGSVVKFFDGWEAPGYVGTQYGV